MKHLILAAALLTSTSLFANVKSGNYVGVDQNGKSCSFTVKDAMYEEDYVHPLTTSIELTKVNFAAFKIFPDQFQTTHPTTVNIESGEISYNNDIFQSTMWSLEGAVSVTLLKSNRADKTPKGIIYIEDNYKDKAKSKKVVCLL